MGNLASTYGALGRHADALAMKERVLEFRRRVLPANHPHIGEGLRGEGWVACGLDILILCFQACHYTTSHVLLLRFSGMALYNLSCSYKTSGSLPRALECAREALRIWQASLPPGHEHVAAAQSHVRRLERALQ